MVLTIGLDIYTYQIDYSGNVSNIIYIKWMEIGRLKLLEAVGLPVQDIARHGVVPVLASTEIDYLRPLILGDRVRLDLWLEEIDRSSVLLGYRFGNDQGQFVARGRQRMVFAHWQTHKAHRITPEQDDRFRGFLELGGYAALAEVAAAERA